MYPVTGWINCLVKFNNSHKLWYVTRVTRWRIKRTKESIETYYEMLLYWQSHKKIVRQLSVIFEHRDITGLDSLVVSERIDLR